MKMKMQIEHSSKKGCIGCKKKIIMTHRKDMIYGDYLIDDRTANGAAQFKGEHIHFGTSKFPDWASVVKYLL